WRPHNRPLHGLLGVATRRAETAGGGSAAEVDLDVVTLPEARALRAILLRAKAGATRTPGGPAGGRPGRRRVAGRGRRRRGRRGGLGHGPRGGRGPGRAGPAAAPARRSGAGRASRGDARPPA